MYLNKLHTETTQKHGALLSFVPFGFLVRNFLGGPTPKQMMPKSTKISGTEL